jgi:2-succinyl-6-hydroxy-2,4-cyclohexadiene-1-carboxylate synthase
MAFVKIQNTRYHYIAAGAGPPLLLLHGFTGCTENWAEVMPALAQQHHVFAIDLPGHGQTQAPDDVTQFTLPVVSQQLAQFINTVISSPAHVLGYSMGGRLALYLAWAHPAQVRSLLLESASPGLADADERAARIASDEALAERITRDGITAFADEWERLPLWASQRTLPAEKRQRLRALRLQNDPHGLALSLRGMGAGAQPSLWGKLGELRLPTVLLAGERDAKFVAIAQRMADAIPRSQLHIIPNVGHTVHLEQPEQFTAHVLAANGPF